MRQRKRERQSQRDKEVCMTRPPILSTDSPPLDCTRLLQVNAHCEIDENVGLPLIQLCTLAIVWLDVVYTQNTWLVRYNALRYCGGGNVDTQLLTLGIRPQRPLGISFLFVYLLEHHDRIVDFWERERERYSTWSLCFYFFTASPYCLCGGDGRLAEWQPARYDNVRLCIHHIQWLSGFLESNLIPLWLCSSVVWHRLLYVEESASKFIK